MRRSTIFEWKLEPVAVAAFLLSLSAALAQFFAWWNGASIKLIAPDRVALYSNTAPNGSTVVRIAAPMSYANVAQSPYGDLVVVERASMSVGGTQTRQRWNAFGTITTERVTQTGPAIPQSLPGQSAISHFTLFAPVPVDCRDNTTTCDQQLDYLTLENFNDRVRMTDKLRFRFEIDLIGRGPLAVTCFVPLTSLVRQELGRLATTPLYALCRSS